MKIKIDNTLEQNVNCLINGENDGDFKIKGNTKSVIINEHEVLKHWNQDTALAGGDNSGSGSNIFLRPYGSGATTNQAQLYPSGKFSIKELAVDGAATIGGAATVNSITVNSGMGKKYTFTKTVTPTTDWVDVGIARTDLSTGAYIVYMTGIYDSNMGWQNDNVYVGLMSWFDSGTNSSERYEIPLHTAGHAHNGYTISLSTLSHSGNTTNTTLQIKSNIAFSRATTIKFTFIKLI